MEKNEEKSENVCKFAIKAERVCEIIAPTVSEVGWRKHSSKNCIPQHENGRNLAMKAERMGEKTSHNMKM